MQSDCYKFNQFQTVVAKQIINILYINHTEPQVTNYTGMFAKKPHEAVSCALPDRAAIATRAEMVPKPCGWHALLDTLALAASDIGPTYDQGMLKGPRMVDHVRLMT